MTSGPDPERWQRVKRILDEALDLGPDRRPAFLEGACAGDETLRREVESLAAAAEGAWSFVDRAAYAGTEALADPAPRSHVGERIGTYEILGELGHGGMGMVYLARRADEEFEKRVALKVIRPGMAGELAVKRFRGERQISASLDHPNIARLLDGGTSENGEPYFVMEFVEGEALLDYCDRHRLSVEERLRLFGEVCAAVQHAHRNLVVHRDIKPSNILVTTEGVPKLLDFGIAKLLSPEGALEPADQTATVSRVLTPDYASPEQVRGQSITTASDVYSLGVVLYELLAGRRPYHLTSTDPGELLRVVCQHDPEKPSTAAARPKAGEGAAASAGARPESRPGLARSLKGDLDAIVLKALRKEPERRYASVEQLSEDIRRHLSGRPVLARRGTTAYRTGKFVRRHRALLAGAVLLLAALAGGVVATLREATHARAAEARAQRRFNDVRKLANSFLFEFEEAIRDLPGSTPARALVVRRALEYLDGLSRESAGDRELRLELAEAYHKVGDVEGNPFRPNLGDMKAALASYGKAIDLLEPAVASGGATDAEISTLATVYLAAGGVRLATGDANAAVATTEKGLRLRRGLAEKRPDDSGRAVDLAQAWQFYAFHLSAAGRSAESYEALVRQAAILRQRLSVAPADRQMRRNLGQNLYLTAVALQAKGDPDGALKSFQEGVVVEEALLEKEPGSSGLRRDLAYLRTEFGNLHESRKNYSAALEQFRLALALFHAISDADPKSADGRLGVAIGHHNIGTIWWDTGDLETALKEFSEARRFYEPVVAADPANTWAAGMLAKLYFLMGDVEKRMANGLPAPARRERFERACAFYSLASEVYARLKAAGTLHAVQGENSEETAQALTRCRGSRD
jgi:non-specific serine/threonine protein kinase/serine/threonine-protein kinase